MRTGVYGIPPLLILFHVSTVVSIRKRFLMKAGRFHETDFRTLAMQDQESATSLLSSFEHLLMLMPLVILKANADNRVVAMALYFELLPEERDSLTAINRMLVDGMVANGIALPAFQIIGFLVYNLLCHPWARILRHEARLFPWEKKK